MSKSPKTAHNKWKSKSTIIVRNDVLNVLHQVMSTSCIKPSWVNLKPFSHFLKLNFKVNWKIIIGIPWNYWKSKIYYLKKYLEKLQIFKK